MEERRGSGPGGAVLGAVGGKVTGVELGMLLSFLSSRVLGQYETFAPATRDLPAAPNGGGRLLLVAPNIVHVERELDVDPHDFRLWVCLHEETHRTQFTAVPWLRDHLEGEIQSFLAETDVDPMTFLERIREAAQSLAGARPEGEQGEGDDGGRSLVELVQTPAQREILARLTAVMSLLEGHADFVMDGVGPAVVPSVDRDPGEVPGAPCRRVRPAWTWRCASSWASTRSCASTATASGSSGPWSNEVGMDGFNRVWTSPNTLPTKAEIAKPADWVARVHRKSEACTVRQGRETNPANGRRTPR